MTLGVDLELPCGREYGASDDAQAVAQGAARRQAQQLRGDQWSPDREERSNLLGGAGDPGATVFDKEAAVWEFSDSASASTIKGVVGQLLGKESTKPLERRARL